MNPYKRCRFICTSSAGTCATFTTENRAGCEKVEGIGSHTRVFCSLPSEVCPIPEPASFPGALRSLHLSGAAGSAAAARLPALRRDLASPVISKHPASYFTPRLSRFIYTDRGCSETKEYFFFLRQRCFIFLEGLCFLLER